MVQVFIAFSGFFRCTFEIAARYKWIRVHVEDAVSRSPDNSITHNKIMTPFFDPVPLGCVQGCKNKSAGYVTQYKPSARSEGAATACIRTAGGQGICWPGGASGYNINQFLDA